jgi:2-polyprenyl-6-methoxyphenol hydroxylase-like FAD-dependent oxidoreductase
VGHDGLPALTPVLDQAVKFLFGYVRMGQVVVIGAGVAGLGAALALGRAGHEIVILERDATPLPTNADEAFAWDRRGAPQVRHSHALLARLRNLLRDRHPDVLAALLEAGATELRFTEHLPLTIADRSQQPGDEDLVALACRRTTFEWVLRRIVLAEPHVSLRDGVIVDGLEAEPGPDGIPRITGVRLSTGEVVAGDLIVAANGRRSPLPAWLAEAGADEVPEEEEDTGIVYYSRFYRLCAGVDAPEQEGPVGADLGYLKFAVFEADNGTFSVTLAIGNHDDELRAAVGKPAAFDAAARMLVPVVPWLAPGVSEAITPVHPMARLLNRRRKFVVDGVPLAVGFAALGDASVCTNPLYGRGCSLAMVHAELLADALAIHDDAVELAVAFDEATVRELDPWYQASVSQDRMNRAAAGDDGAVSEEHQMMRSLLREGLLPATRTDAVVFRAFIRSFNLLESPESLMTDPELMARVLTVWQAREEREPDPPLGPERAELLAALSRGR